MSNSINCLKCKHLNSYHFSEDGKTNFKCWERNSPENNDFCGCTHGKPEETVLILYAVQNYEGKFFKAKGYSRYGESWVDNIQKARIYPNISPAKACVTYFAKHNPYDLPIPEILELVVVQAQIIDQNKTVSEINSKKESKSKNSQLKKLQNELEKIKKEIENIK